MGKQQNTTVVIIAQKGSERLIENSDPFYAMGEGA